MQRNSLIIIIVIIVAVSIASVTIYFTQQPETETYVVKIGYIDGIFNLHNWVAQDYGLFEKHGVKTEFVKFASSNQVADAYINGQIDVAGIIASEVIMSVEAKQPESFFVFYCFTFDRNAPVINIVVKDELITSIDDLDGKKMAVFPGSMPPLMNKIVWQKLGTNATIQEIPLPPASQLEALATDQVQAAETFTPFELIAEAKGIGHVLIPAPWETYISDPFVGSCAAFRPSFVKEHPRLAEGVFESIDEAARFINTNEPEGKKTLANHLPIDAAIIEKIRMPSWRPASDVEGQIQTFIDILYEGKIIERRIEAGDLLYEKSQKVIS